MTNWKDEAKFHKTEGHKMVDNRDSTNDIFKYALKDSYGHMDKELSKKVPFTNKLKSYFIQVFNMRHRRE